jgi:acetyl esterase/lipase
MAIKKPKNASLSEVDPEFAPFIPGINERFEEIWRFKTAQELRDKVQRFEAFISTIYSKNRLPDFTQPCSVTNGSVVEVRVYRPEGVTSVLPVFYMIQGGGMFESDDC